jgi:hypothetical protein
LPLFSSTQPLQTPTTPFRDGQDGEKSGNAAASGEGIEPQ